MAQLTPLCELFFDRLAEEKILLKNQEKNSDPFYSWNNDSPRHDSEEVGVNESLSALIPSYDDLDQTVRSIYLEFKGQDAQPKLLLKQMIVQLIQSGVLKDSFNSKNLDDLIYARNKVIRGVSIDESDLETIEKSKFELRRLKTELIESYVYFIAQRYLKDFNFRQETRAGFDFIATGERISIAFEVKQVSNTDGNRRFVKEVVDKFSNFEKSSTNMCVCILLVYQQRTNGKRSSPGFNFFFKEFSNLVPTAFKTKLFVYPTSSRPDQELNASEIEDHLQECLNQLAQITDADLVNESTEDDLFRDSEKIILEKAKRDWPTDFQMQQHEIETQQKALSKLKTGKPDDISNSDFQIIRENAQNKWPRDYMMWQHEEQQQIAALRKLTGGNGMSSQ